MDLENNDNYSNIHIKNRKRRARKGNHVSLGINDDLEQDVEKSVDNILEDRDNSKYNFLINASNQANLINAQNDSYSQVNLIFVLVSPYYMENFDIEDMNINIKMDGEGTLLVNDHSFSPIEVKPGIKVFGLRKGVY